MELSEGLAALEGLRALEGRLDAKLKDAKSKAAKIVDAASAKALAMVGEKEARITSLSLSQRPAAIGAADQQDFAPDEKFAEEMACDILENIKKSG